MAETLLIIGCLLCVATMIVGIPAWIIVDLCDISWLWENRIKGSLVAAGIVAFLVCLSSVFLGLMGELLVRLA